MTICTDRVAFRKLFQQFANRHPAVAVQVRHVAQLLFALAMVEIHDIVRIALSTIHARLALGSVDQVTHF